MGGGHFAVLAERGGTIGVFVAAFGVVGVGETSDLHGAGAGVAVLKVAVLVTVANTRPSVGDYFDDVTAGTGFAADAVVGYSDAGVVVVVTVGLGLALGEFTDAVLSVVASVTDGELFTVVDLGFSVFCVGETAIVVFVSIFDAGGVEERRAYISTDVSSVGLFVAVSLLDFAVLVQQVVILSAKFNFLVHAIGVAVSGSIFLVGHSATVEVAVTC